MVTTKNAPLPPTLGGSVPTGDPLTHVKALLLKPQPHEGPGLGLSCHLLFSFVFFSSRGVLAALWLPGSG